MLALLHMMILMPTSINRPRVLNVQSPPDHEILDLFQIFSTMNIDLLLQNIGSETESSPKLYKFFKILRKVEIMLKTRLDIWCNALYFNVSEQLRFLDSLLLYNHQHQSTDIRIKLTEDVFAIRRFMVHCMKWSFKQKLLNIFVLILKKLLVLNQQSSGRFNPGMLEQLQFLVTKAVKYLSPKFLSELARDLSSIYAHFEAIIDERIAMGKYVQVLGVRNTSINLRSFEISQFADWACFVCTKIRVYEADNKCLYISSILSAVHTSFFNAQN